MNRQIAVITTYAECYRDVHEVIAAFAKTWGVWLNPTKLEALNPEGYEVEFVINLMTFNPDQVRAAIDRVDDAGDMNEHMVVETFEAPRDTWICNGADVRRLGTLISTVKYAEDDDEAE